MTIIKDGTGTGQSAKVDETNRLKVKSLVITTELHAALEGNAFCVSSGIITLTNTCTHALLYLTSCECIDVVLRTLFLDFGDAAGATDAAGVMNFHFGPTAGTLICDACAVTPNNERIGDSQTLCATAYKASGIGKTLTGGNVTTFPLTSNAFGYEFTEEIIIPKGQAFGISYAPPTGTTSQPVEIGFKILRGVVNGD